MVIKESSKGKYGVYKYVGSRNNYTKELIKRFSNYDDAYDYASKLRGSSRNKGVYYGSEEIVESVRNLKEEIDPSDYTAVTIAFDMAVPRNNIPRSSPDSPFVHAIYNAMEKLGYFMITDDYSFDIEKADYYSEKELEDLLGDW